MFFLARFIHQVGYLVGAIILLPIPAPLTSCKFHPYPDPSWVFLLPVYLSGGDLVGAIILFLVLAPLITSCDQLNP